MTTAFAPDTCNHHESPARGWVSLAVLGALLLGCGGGFEAARLEARPTGKYSEVITWVADGSEGGPSHRIDVEIEIDPAQLMGWSKTNIQYHAYLDVRLERDGVEPIEEMLLFPITEARTVSESRELIQIAYLAAGDQLPSGFRLVPGRRAFSFRPTAGPQRLSVHLRTPGGADRQSLRAIRTVRLLLHTGKDGPEALTNARWAEAPRSKRGS